MMKVNSRGLILVKPEVCKLLIDITKHFMRAKKTEREAWFVKFIEVNVWWIFNHELLIWILRPT